MMKFKKISLLELKNIVYLSYENDVDLCNKYHSINKLEPNQSYNINECADITYNRIEEASKHLDLEYYKIVYKKNTIGYIAVFENILYSFAIAVKYRVKDILKIWWEKVSNVLGNGFVTFIYDNNARCLNFLLKNNMEVIDEEKGIITLKNI